MNDKDRELLAQILHAGGAAAQKGFEELVRWCLADAIANVLCYAGVATLGVYLLVRLFRWKPDPDDRSDRDMAYIMRAIGMVVVCIILAIATGTWLPGNLRELVSPKGEAVAYVISHH